MRKMELLSRPRHCSEDADQWLFFIVCFTCLPYCMYMMSVNAQTSLARFVFAVGLQQTAAMEFEPNVQVDGVYCRSGTTCFYSGIQQSTTACRRYDCPATNSGCLTSSSTTSKSAYLLYCSHIVCHEHVRRA